jgi:hypothetical protein
MNTETMHSEADSVNVTKESEFGLVPLSLDMLAMVGGGADGVNML